MTTAEDPALPTFDAAQLAAIAPFGQQREVTAGEVLYRAGSLPRSARGRAAAVGEGSSVVRWVSD